MTLCYSLIGDAGAAFAKGLVGKLAPVFLPHADALACTRLDCFDQSLRRSGRMLLDTGTAWNLLLPDGTMVSQDMRRPRRFVADLPDGPVKQALADMSPLRSLLTFGSGRHGQSTIAFVDDEHKTCCRAALHCLTGAEGAVVTLVALQGLRGYAKALADVHGQVIDCGGTVFDMEALYGQIYPGQTAIPAQPKVILTQSQSANQAATQIIARYILVVRRNELGIIADFDTEFLHDYRVALRKIRSLLSLFTGVYQPSQTASLKAQFSAIMAQTGPLRDLDVHLLERQATFEMLPDSLHPGLDAIFALRTVERSVALAKLAHYLSSADYAQTINDLSQTFSTPDALQPGPKADTPVRDLSSALIWKRYQKARQIADTITPQTPETEVHALRIHCKKLRYLMEFAASLFPETTLKAAIKPLKIFQDHLGHFNDMSVQLVNLHNFANGSDTWPDKSKLQIAQSVGALTLVLHQRKVEARAKIEQLVARFTSPQVQETFRAIFHPRKPNP